MKETPRSNFIQEDQATTQYIAPHRSHEQDSIDTTKEGAVKRLVYLMPSHNLMLKSISSNSSENES